MSLCPFNQTVPCSREKIAGIARNHTTHWATLHAEAGAAQTRGPCRAQLRHSQEEQGAQGWGELRQPRAPQPPQTQETSGEVPDRTNKQTNKRQRDEADQGGLPWPQLPPQARSQPQVSGRGVGPGWELAQMRREGSLAPPKPSAQWQQGQDTIQRGGQASLKPHSCVWGCSCPAGVKGMGQMDLLPHSQPAWGTVWLPLGAGGSRCALKSPQAGISSSFILVGDGTGNPFLASSPRSQSLSCARLSSVMPWAASSARTLSR